MTKNILVVDDTPDNLRLLITLLTKTGYKVRPAPNGRLALSAATTIPPDLILLDINMPKMNGYEVCKRLKANPITRNIPVIFLSALDQTLDKIQAFKVGGVDYITKPFEYQEVIARIETHLTLRDTQKRLEEKNNQLQQEITKRQQIEKTLVASEAQLRALFAAMTDVILIMDKNGLHLKVSSPSPKLLYKPADKLLGKTLHQVLPKDIADFWLNKIEECLDSQKTNRIEYNMVVDNTEIWFDAKISPMFNDTVVIVARDITDHVQNEMALQQHSHEMALIHRASQGFNSSLKADVIMQSVLDEMHQLFNIVATSFWLYNPEKKALICQQASGPGHENVIGWQLPIDKGIAGWVARHGKSQIITNVQQDKRYYKKVADYIELNVNSMLSIPIQTTGEMIGVLNLIDTQINRFSNNDLILLEPIASAAASAIKNARLFAQEKEAKRKSEIANSALKALNSVATAVNQSLDLKKDLENALKVIVQTLQLNLGWILLAENKNKLLRLVASVGFPNEFIQQETLTAIDKCDCGAILESGELQHHFKKDTCQRLTPYLTKYPTLSTQHISLPIFVKQKSVALLNLGGDKVTDLTDDDYAWLETVSQQLGNAIENAILYQSMRNKTQRLTVLSRVSTIISHSWQLDRVLPPLLSEVAKVLEMSLAAIILRTTDHDHKYQVRTLFGRWQSPKELKNTVWHQLSLLKTIEKTRAPLLILKATTDNRISPLINLIKQENIKTILILPLVVRNQLIGFIKLCALTQKDIFEMPEMELARTLTNQAAIAIEKSLLHEETVARYEEELEIARQIQQNLLPRTNPNIPGLHIAGLCHPAYATGGDFYDYISLPNNNFGIVVGDVTGKSLPAAMVMALARNTIRSELVNHDNVDEAIMMANKWLCQDIRQGTFIAAVQAIINPIDHKLYLVNAGQTAPILLRNGQLSYMLSDELAGLPLGIEDTIIYEQMEIPLRSNDLLLFYTDGIVEAQNAKSEMFGFERLETILQTLPSSYNAQKILDTLMDSMTNFVGGAEQHDDITIVVVQVD